MALRASQWGEGNQVESKAASAEELLRGGNDDKKIAVILANLKNDQASYFEVTHDHGCQKLGSDENLCTCDPDVKLVHREPLKERA